MSATAYKEEQRLRNPGLIALLTLLTALVIYRTVVTYANGATGADLLATGLIALVLGLGWYAVYSMRLRIKVGKKNLKIKTKGLLGPHLKLRKSEMADCRFVEVPPSARWSGALADPNSDFRCIDFGGKHSLCVRMRDGRFYCITSDDLFARRHDIALPTPAQAS